MNPFSRDEENPLTDVEYDAECIREFEQNGPIESGTAEYGGREWAHENPQAWRLVLQREGRERTEQLVQIIRAAGHEPILPLWERSTT